MLFFFWFAVRITVLPEGHWVWRGTGIDRFVAIEYWHYIVLFILWDTADFQAPQFFFDIRAFFQGLHIRGILLAVLGFLFVRVVILYFADTSLPVPRSYQEVFFLTLYLGIALPGKFYVAHTVFYGPMMLMGLLFWKQICCTIRNYGFGLTLSLTAVFFLSLGSESRSFINFYPLVVPFIVKTVDSFAWRRFHYWIFAGISVLGSKVWLPIRWQGGGDFYQFPAQDYFMNHGPWMGYEMYLVQGILVLLLGAFFYALFSFSGKRKEI